MAEGLTGQHSSGLWGHEPFAEGLTDQQQGLSSVAPLRLVSRPNTMKPCKEDSRSRDLDSAHLTESTPNITGTAAELTTSNPRLPSLRRTTSGSPASIQRLHLRHRVKTRDGKGCLKRHAWWKLSRLSSPDRSPEPHVAESATGTLWEGLHSDIREDLSEAKSQECTTESSISLQRLLRLTEQYPV